MPLGNILSGTEQQYVANKDDKETWRILNTWHEDLKHLDADDEIDDDSPAVLCLSEGQFIALIKEAATTGQIQNANFGGGDTEELEREFTAELDMKQRETERLQEKLDNLQNATSEVMENSLTSEEYRLKEKAMASILKLVSMQDMTNLTRE
jgi:hypothetical protein|tara:strand:+ start:6678 stop:7133 length:456 start_codon:yes stop_codon:yes gene_type:complete